jgi:cell division protein FtsI (penicillin-binding protein 3)
MQVNGFFHKPRILVLTGAAFLLSVVIFSKFAILAFSGTPSIVPDTRIVERGSIVDRNGKPLAVETSFYHFGVSPSAMKSDDIPAFAHAVAPMLQMNESSIIAMIRESSGANFIYIKKRIDQNTYEQLQKVCIDNNFVASRFDRIPGRIYPENTLASQLIGFMGDDGAGLSGIEYSMQNILSPPLKPENQAPDQGKNIYLTIDANLQYKLEKVARDSMNTTQAESLMLIAADARSGEILSYISLPAANLNDYTHAKPSEMIDRPATQSFEPGSVFKIYTVASLLDAGVITENDSFFCDGVYEKTFPGGRIRITCLDHHGWVTPREALKYSCNDALAQMSDKINPEDFLTRIRALGFGERTGIELPGETRGSVKNTNDRYWSGRSKPTMAIGQEIGVSALQMVEAATAITNKGIPVQLTVISRITNHDGSDSFVHQPVYRKRVFKQSTTDYLLSCMETVAQSGTGYKAALGDISIGVKTGTAQMADTKNGGYSTTDFLSDCIAVFPVENPQIILYIVVEKAKGETYAGRIVAPVIAQAADIIIDHLGLSRGGAASLTHSGRISIAGNEPIKMGQQMPDFTGVSKRQLIPLVDRKDIHVKINGDGWVKSQMPPPGTPITENMEIELNLE